jgi:hypothetical protein
MSQGLQGFSDFFYTESEEVSPSNGLTELKRLATGHYLFALPPVSHKLARHFFGGGLFPGDFAGAKPLDEKLFKEFISKLTSQEDSIVILSFPRRWEKKLGRQSNPKELLHKMIGEVGQVGNYVWGMYSLWNPRLEEHDAPHFYRNPRYHAHDGLCDKWLKKHPSPVKEKPALPLEKQTRPGHELLFQGRHSFHGYNDGELGVKDG